MEGIKIRALAESYFDVPAETLWAFEPAHGLCFWNGFWRLPLVYGNSTGYVYGLRVNKELLGLGSEGR